MSTTSVKNITEIILAQGPRIVSPLLPTKYKFPVRSPIMAVMQNMKIGTTKRATMQPT